MSASAIAVLVVPLIIVLLTWWLDFCVSASRSRIETSDTFYSVSKWVYFIFAVAGAMCGLFLMWSFDENQNAGAREIMLIAGVAGLLISVMGFWWHAKSFVRLSNTELIIEAPFSHKVVHFNKLKNVRVSGGMIIFDEGEIPRVVVPLIYKNSGQLLANVEARRLRCTH